MAIRRALSVTAACLTLLTGCSSSTKASKASYTPPPDPLLAGRYEHFTVHGKRSGLTGEVTVWLPKGYNPSGTTKYPVIFAFHGYPGHPDSIFPSTHLDKTIQEEVDAGRLAPPIVVMPQENMPPSRDTECINAGGEKTGTWLGEDVPDFVKSTFKVKTGRENWATWGFSTGGWCAAVTATQHPSTFGAVASLVGYFRPDFEPNYVPLKPGSPAYPPNDLIHVMRTEPPRISYYVLAAQEDPISYPTSKEFADAVRSPATVKAVFPSGSHSIRVWYSKIPDSVLFFTALTGFRPEPH